MIRENKSNNTAVYKKWKFWIFVLVILVVIFLILWLDRNYFWIVLDKVPETASARVEVVG